MDAKEFIKQRPHLIWYVKDAGEVSDESIVEHVLNYGTFKDVKELIQIMGIEKMASIFRKQISNRRDNYKPQIKNYFALYFDKYAPEDSK